MSYKLNKPQKIRLDISTLCQLKCPICTNANKEIANELGFGYLKYDNFKHLIVTNPSIKHIEISNYGEIFLNPDLLSILKLSHKNNVRLYADNGVNLNDVDDEVLESIVKYKLRRMTCSIDGATQDTYHKYRKNGNFNTVISNIKKINLHKNKYQSRFPVLTWQYVIFGHNENEIASAKKAAKSLNMKFQPKLSWDSEYSPIKNSTLVKNETGLSLESGSRQMLNNAFPCHQLWEEPQINWDGKILGCCWNYWKEFGRNAFSDGLIKSLNMENITYARQMLIGNAPHRDDLPCSTCSLYIDFKKNGVYLKRGILRQAYLMARNIYKYFKY